MGHCKDCMKWDKDDTSCQVKYLDSDLQVRGKDVALYAYACDDYGLVAVLKTGPEFGCLAFKAK